MTAMEKVLLGLLILAILAALLAWLAWPFGEPEQATPPPPQRNPGIARRGVGPGRHRPMLLIGQPL